MAENGVIKKLTPAERSFYTAAEVRVIMDVSRDTAYRIVLCDDVQSAKDWKRAKLKCLESIFRRFSFEPDTTVGPTSFKFGDRAKLWQEEYEKLKKDLKLASVSPSAILMNAGDTSKQPVPYFYNGMMSHEESDGVDI